MLYTVNRLKRQITPQVVTRVNIALSAIWVILLLLNVGQLRQLAASSSTTILDFVPVVLAVTALLVSSYLAFFQRLNTRTTLPSTIAVVLTVLPLCWFCMYVVGSFFVTNLWFPSMMTALMVGMYYLMQKSSRRLAAIVTALTCLVLLAVIVSTFEEAHCSQKGRQHDPSGKEMTEATQEDADVLSDFGITAGQMIGVGFREHMLCHSDFKLGTAVAERYFFTK